MPNLDYFILGEGPVVLFLHGWGQNKEMMLSLANRLKRNYKCILVDMPGFGSSDYNGEKSLDEYCKSIHDFLLLKLHVKPDYIVGHSFGGKVALHYYLKYRTVSGLVLVASPVLKPVRRLKYYINLYLYKIKKHLKIKNDMGSSDYKSSGDMKNFFVHVVNSHYDKCLKSVYIPVLLVYSKEDEKVDFRKAKKLKRKIKKSKLKVIKGDHFAYLSNEKIISMEINSFIKENGVNREYYL